VKALVTGASRGLGEAIAKRLASDGFEVWIHYRQNEDQAEKVLREIESSGGKGRLVQLDVSDAKEIEQKLFPILSKEGPLDVLVNNAGVTAEGYMMMMPQDKWDEVMDVNLGGFFLVTRACLKGMVEKRGGRVVNICSLAGERADVGQVAYAASKAGIAGATRALAMEMARWNILVNAVSPGPLDVGMATGLDPKKILPHIPLGRVGTADEAAGAVSFLCSEDASYITGQIIRVNGGMGM
jgi:3-oxoacyl-[acyl-carrier protein] reductase